MSNVVNKVGKCKALHFSKGIEFAMESVILQYMSVVSFLISPAKVTGPEISPADRTSFHLLDKHMME